MALLQNPMTPALLNRPVNNPSVNQTVPQFMQNYTQIAPNKFVPDQGVLGLPPQMQQTQSLFSQDYGQEYGALEDKFQRSFAVDPRNFQQRQAPPKMVMGPSTSMAVNFAPPDNGLDFGKLAGVGAGALLLDKYGNVIEDTIKQGVDYLGKQTKQFEEGVLKPFTETYVQPAIDAVKDPIEQGIETVGEYTKSVEEDVLKPFTETYVQPVLDPFKDVADDVGVVTKQFEEGVLKPFGEEYIQPILDPIKDIYDEYTDTNLKDLIPDSLKDAYGAGKEIFGGVGEVENLIDNPTTENAFKAIDSVNTLSEKYLGAGSTVIPPQVAGLVIDGAGLLSIANAFEDPTAENIANAYVGADHLATNYTGSTGLPFAEQAAGVGSILGGLAALEGGIDSPAEAVAVANAASAIAGMTGATTGFMSGLAGAGAFLGPLALGIGAVTMLADKGSEYGNAVLERDKYGNYDIASESSKNDGYKSVIPEANVAGVVFNELEQAYGFEFDEDAWNSVNKRVDYDSGQMVRKADDMIAEAIQAGALKPTAATPTGLNFANLIGSARDIIAQSGDRAYKGKSSSEFGITKNMAAFEDLGIDLGFGDVKGTGEKYGGLYTKDIGRNVSDYLQGGDFSFLS